MDPYLKRSHRALMVVDGNGRKMDNIETNMKYFRFYIWLMESN